jgi:hypothetical protein
MPDTSALYAQDFFAWTRAQAALLETGQLSALDIPHLIEEMLALGSSEQSQLGNRLIVLLAHLLKGLWTAQHQPLVYDSNQRGWRISCRNQRREIAKLLRRNSSLRPTVPEEVLESYPSARGEAALALGLTEEMLPPECPWTPEQVLQADWWPV